MISITRELVTIKRRADNPSIRFIEIFVYEHDTRDVSNLQYMNWQPVSPSGAAPWTGAYQLEFKDQDEAGS